jgi:hypothetical protein
MKNIIYLIAVIVAFVACNSSVEGETKTWNHSKEEITHLKLTYPSLASYLNEDLTHAESEWEKALKISSDETKIEALENINKSLNNGLLGRLVLMNRNNKNIESLVDDMDALMAKDSIKSDYLKDDRERAEIQLKKYKEYKNNGFNVHERQEALSTLNLFLNNQKEEIANLKNVIAIVEKLMAADSKTVSTSADDTLNRQKKEAQAVFVKCSFCGSLVDQKIAKCNGCGANL